MSQHHLAKPCMGYPTRTAAVKALSEQGMSSDMIAHKTGMDTRTVAALRQNLVRQRERRAKALERLLSEETLMFIEAAAETRGVNPGALAMRIIDTVAREEIIDAVLDDQPAREKVA